MLFSWFQMEVIPLDMLLANMNKQKLWMRIHAEMRQEVSRREAAIANKLQREMEAVAVREERPVRAPTQREVELHEVTHCPFKPWCDACVQGKSKSNHAVTQPQQAEVSPNPRIQMDFMYARANKEDEPVIGLVMVCVWTRMTKVIVSQTKHSAPPVEECVRFGLELNYLGMLEYAADCEPACIQLLNSVKRSRQAMGFLTGIVPNKNYDKSGTAMAERFVQTIRRQMVTLIEHIRGKTGVEFDHTHPLYSWCFCMRVGRLIGMQNLPRWGALRLRQRIGSIW